jgi:hypothetical protein
MAQAAPTKRTKRRAAPTLTERGDWTDFRTLETLGRKGGVPAWRIPMLVVKELADNALDASGGFRAYHLPGGGFYVEDDGDGIPGDDATVARLFSIGRPLASSKHLRLPTRGALGNGLRLVAGAVLASGGSLTVCTRGRSLRLAPQDGGTTKVLSTEPWERAGTRVEVRFGPALPVDPDELFTWTDHASKLAGRGTGYGGRSSPWWYTPEAFWTFLQANGARPVRDVVALLDACSKAVAGKLGDRPAESIGRAEAAALLKRAREAADPVEPKRLGKVGPLPHYESHYKVCGEFQFGRGPLAAHVPVVVEAWANVADEPSVVVCVNRTPITADVTVRRDGRDRSKYAFFGCNTGYCFPARRNRDFAFLLNVQCPVMPITTDGKEPDFDPVAEEVLEALGKAAAGAARQAAEEERQAAPAARLPAMPKGRPSEEARAKYNADLAGFADRLRKMESTVDFKVSSRGWCYLLENAHVIAKGDFDRAQGLINDCRKCGLLPIDFTAEDSARAADNVELLDDADPARFAGELAAALRGWDRYCPVSFWDFQPVYVQMVVEKIDLKSLFSAVCREYHVPLMNGRGWSDLNLRAKVMRRFKEHEEKGRRPVLLLCGDHDPVGLDICKQFLKLLAELEAAVGWSPANLKVKRFGLNADFIEAHGLTWIEGLATASGRDLGDPRHRQHHADFVQGYIATYGKRKVEANALVVRPEAGRQLCRQAIEMYLDLGAIAAYQRALVAPRQRVLQAVPAAVNQVLGQIAAINGLKS